MSRFVSHIQTGLTVQNVVYIQFSACNTFMQSVYSITCFLSHQVLDLFTPRSHITNVIISAKTRLVHSTSKVFKKFLSIIFIVQGMVHQSFSRLC